MHYASASRRMSGLGIQRWSRERFAATLRPRKAHACLAARCMARGLCKAADSPARFVKGRQPVCRLAAGRGQVFRTGFAEHSSRRYNSPHRIQQPLIVAWGLKEEGIITGASRADIHIKSCFQVQFSCGKVRAKGPYRAKPTK